VSFFHSKQFLDWKDAAYKRIIDDIDAEMSMDKKTEIWLTDVPITPKMRAYNLQKIMDEPDLKQRLEEHFGKEEMKVKYPEAYEDKT